MKKWSIIMRSIQRALSVSKGKSALFERTDIVFARGVNCIRRLYLENAPQLQSYFMLSTHDDRGETLSHEAILTTKPNSTEWKEDKKNGHPVGYPYSCCAAVRLVFLERNE